MSVETFLENSKHILIYVKKIDYGIVSGVFFNVYLNKLETFNCLEELILKIDKLIVVINHCNKENKVIKSSAPFPKTHADLNIGWFPAYFFSLEIFFERNYSWQGSLQYAKSDKVYYFKSALQLIKQFAEVMNLAKEPLFFNSDAISAV